MFTSEFSTTANPEMEGKTTTATLHGEPSNSAALPPRPEEEEVDKDMLCPICMQVMKDPFLTPCGHTFCYMCITTHLLTKNNCPCCSHFLTANSLYPNFLLNKLLVKARGPRTAKAATPSEQLRRALQQGCDMSVKELDSLLSLISEKKLKKEQEEAETNLQIMNDFMHCLRKKQIDELNEIQADLRYIKEDLRSVERRCVELCQRKERMYSAKLEVHDEAAITADQTRVQKGKAEERSIASNLTTTKDPHESKNPTQPELALARRGRVHAMFNNLQACYLQRRRFWETKMVESGSYGFSREGYTRGLEDFESALSTFTRYSRLRVVAELGHRDMLNSDGIVSSIEFDTYDEFFATAGASQPIKIFEFSTVVNEPDKSPVVEMSTRSKLSCLSWNKYTKNHIASSDYEGIVTIWDVNTRQFVTEYEEHEQCAWSVDFSHKDPFMLVSGSDDCKVKVWCTNLKKSVLNIDLKATVYSVKYNPESSVLVAVGCADHHARYYDLRKPDKALKILRCHTKAVKYVKFLSHHELASASTDSRLILWDLDLNLRLRSFREHTNETNFVGLTANNEYMACGSETNEVFVYYKGVSMPAARYMFNCDEDEADEDDSDFISAVCLKSDSPTVVAANSRGMMKVLELAP